MKTISLEELTKFLIFRNKDCIITFSNSNKFDVNKENYIGYEDFHKELFYKNLVEVTNSKDFSTIIVREFNDKIAYKIKKNGKSINIPYKYIYGFFIQNGEINVLNKTLLEQSFDTKDLSEKYLEAF